MYGPFAIARIELTLSGSQRLLSKNPLLDAALFGAETSSSNVAPSKTYAILEGARYFAPRETIESSGLPFECLFKGDSENTLADVAPYLVELNRDASLLSKLLRGHSEDDPPWMMWPKRGASFFRSAHSMDELKRHFRKYTRLFDQATGHWNYFRFYAPEVMLNVISHMEHERFDDFSKGIESFVIPDGLNAVTVLGKPVSSALELAC